MLTFSDITAKSFEENYAECAGAGAAGGLGFALMAFCKASFSSGIDTVLDICEFDEHLKNTSLIITGEGKIDNQSSCGKALYGIGTRAKRHQIPVIALGGKISDGSEKLIDCGITAIFCIANGPATLEYSMKNAEYLLANATQNVIRLWRKF